MLCRTMWLSSYCTTAFSGRNCDEHGGKNNNDTHQESSIHKQIFLSAHPHLWSIITVGIYLNDNTLCCAITQQSFLSFFFIKHSSLAQGQHWMVIESDANTTMGKVKKLNVMVLQKLLFLWLLTALCKKVSVCACCFCRSFFTKTETSKGALMSAAATVPIFTPTSTDATPSGWRVAASWCMRGPTTWAISTIWGEESTLITSVWLALMTVSDLAVWSPR